MLGLRLASSGFPRSEKTRVLWSVLETEERRATARGAFDAVVFPGERGARKARQLVSRSRNPKGERQDWPGCKRYGETR